MVDFDYQKRERAKMNAIPNECDHSAAPPKITGGSADGRASKRQRKKARGAATTAEFADKESAAPAKISVQRVSFEMGGLLYETIVTAEGYFQFAVAGPSGTKIIPSLQNDGSSIEPPYDLRTLWETGLIRFPSAIGLCGSIGELLDEVKAFVSHYANVPQEWLEIIALYILMTWVYDRFTAVPYLRFLGEPGTGKTRLLQICAAISYKGVLVSGNITGPALFRTIDLVRGTMAVDEADFKNSQEWSDIVKVLNNGYTVGTPVIRCGPGDFTPQAFHVYGPKIISTRSRFEDEALESRCITFETSEGPLPKHIPLQLPLSFEREAVTLRNRLLRWRFDNFHHIQAREAEMRDLFPRCGQVGASLAGVAMSASDEHLRRLVSFLSNYDVDQKEASSKGIVRQALANLHESGGASATVGEVADAANAIANSLGSDTLTPKRVGGILRSLGMVPRKKKNGYVVDLVDPKG